MNASAGATDTADTRRAAGEGGACDGDVSRANRNASAIATRRAADCVDVGEAQCRPNKTNLVMYAYGTSTSRLVYGETS